MFRLFKIDPVSNARSIAAVAIVALSSAANDLQSRKVFDAHTRFLSDKKVAIGAMTVKLELEDNEESSSIGYS